MKNPSRCCQHPGAVQPKAEVAQLKRNKVGQSFRTAGKHFLLNKLIARECGVMFWAEKNEWAYPFRPYFVLDLCAGDARPSLDSETSSPSIIQRHLNFLQKNKTPALPPIFAERNKASFDNLKRYVKFGTAANMDATSDQFLQLVKEKIGGRQNFTTFIHNDPNLVTDWAISPQLLSLLNPSAFTTFSTLGCNVGGLKRLPLESRIEWRLRVERLLAAIPDHHCAVLATLDGDKSQWAYLVTVPGKWIEKTTSEIQKAFKQTPFPTTVSVTGKRTVSDLDFYRQLDVLTLTKKEMEGIGEENNNNEAV